jgi:hypothetical protein
VPGVRGKRRRGRASAIASRGVPLEPARTEPLAGARVVLIAIAAAFAAGGGIWIALQPAVTHSELDGPLTGSLLRWFLYFPATLVAVWLAARLLDRVPPPGAGPVRTALTLALPAVLAGTVVEILARLILGRGEVLALDGVLQRILELVRVDVPIGAIVAIMLAHRHGAIEPAHPLVIKRNRVG